MFCENCGAQLDDEEKFCPICGAKVGGEEAPEAETVNADAEETAQPVQQEETQNSYGQPETQNSYAQPAEQAEALNSYGQPAEQAEALNSYGQAEALNSYGQAEAQNSYGQPAEQAEAQNSYGQPENFIFCPSCGTKNAAGCQFCISCGNPLYAQNTEGQTKKKKPVLGIVIGVVCAAAVAAAVFFAVNRSSGGGELKDKQLLYLKDESLYKSTYKKLEPVELAEDVVDDEMIGSAAYKNSNIIAAQYSEDEKYLFYRKCDYSGNKYILYYLNLKDKEPKPEKLDSGNIYSYGVLPGDKVIYLKDDVLYINDLERNKEKIASDVYDFIVSEDGSKVLWGSTEDGKLYYCGTEAGAEKEKLDSEVNSLLFHSGDFSKLVYQKGDSLYMVTDLSDSEKIASHVDTNSTAKVAEGDKGLQILYYKAEDSEEMTLASFVNDDLKAQDDAITEPDIEDYQTTREVVSYGYTRTVTDTSDEYYEKLDEYYDKLDRDDIRGTLAERTIDLSKRSLVLYDDATGETVTVLEDNYANNGIRFYNAEGTAVALISYLSGEDLPTYKFSDIINGNIDVYDIWDVVENAGDALQLKMICGTEVYEPFEEDDIVSDFRISDDGECLYAILSDADDKDSELIKIAISGSEAGSYETLYDDAERIFACKDGKVYYGTDVNYDKDTCDLYCNDERIAYDASTYYSYLLTENNSFLYYTDIDSKNMGTLWLYNGSDPIKISDDVATYYYVNDKKIVVMTDISSRSGEGDIQLYNGKETERIDSDIQAIIVPSENSTYEYADIAYYEEPAVEESPVEEYAETEEAAESSEW